MKKRVFAHWPKKLNLIYYINLAEIVKNFTNFTCGIAEGAIKFRRSSNRVCFCNSRAGV